MATNISESFGDGFKIGMVDSGMVVSRSGDWIAQRRTPPMTIDNGIRVLGLLVLVTLAAGSALAAVQSDSQIAQATAGGRQMTGIEIVAPVGDETVGTIFFGTGAKPGGLRFGGPH